MTAKMPRPPAETPFPPSPDAVQAEANGRIDRLVLAAADQIAERGLAGASSRAIATSAGASPSAINYNFGNIERLLSSALDYAAARTADWIAVHEAEFTTLPASPDMAAFALERLLIGWTGAARPLALVYQEGLAAQAGQPVMAAWTRQWRDLFERLAATLGLGEADGRMMHLFFETEALYHLSTWSPALEAAALRELAEHFAAVWLGARERPVAGALALAEATAGARPFGSIAPAAERIVLAAADVVEAGGLGALTHRAVAAKAGVTTGAVTHHFRTIEDLVAGMIRGQVERLARPADEDHRAPSITPTQHMQSREDFRQGLLHVGEEDGPAETAGSRRRLFLATVRRPEMASAGAVIRFAHGGTARDGLSRLFPIPPERLSPWAGLISRLLASHYVAASADGQLQPGRRRLVGEVVARAMARLPG